MVAAAIVTTLRRELLLRTDMNNCTKSRPLIALALLTLAVLACNRSIATVTPVPPLPTLSVPTHTPPATASPTAPATSTPLPLPTPSPTPVIPPACPPPGDPLPPQRPAAFDDYPKEMAAYLSAGGSAQGLERLLRDWGAITDEAGKVRSLDLTGDADPEVVVALIDPAPEFDLPWPPGDVLILQCQGGAVVPAYQGRAAVGEGPSDLSFNLHRIEDVNRTGRADVVYATSSCGAHTCWDRLYIVEWDGTGFTNRIPGMGDYPHPTFNVSAGRVLVEVGGIASAGAGYQRSYSEGWEWDGRQFVVVERTVGPPTALIHYVHDGDDALARGDYGGAIGHYQSALDDTSLLAGLFLESEEEGTLTVRAYARFKLVVAFGAAGDGRGGQSQYDLLLAEHPEGTSGYPYARLGQAFWGDFVAHEAPRSACAAAVAVAESDPNVAERLYAGYANPEYGAPDLCRIGE